MNCPTCGHPVEPFTLTDELPGGRAETGECKKCFAEAERHRREMMASPRLCCCTHGFYCHDPASCTAPGCWCRGFHEPDAPQALHAALHAGVAPCACPVNSTEGLGGIEHVAPCDLVTW